MSRHRYRPMCPPPPAEAGPGEETTGAVAGPDAADSSAVDTPPPADAALVYFDPDRPRVATFEELRGSVRRTERLVAALDAGLLDGGERGGVLDRMRRAAAAARDERGALVAEVKQLEAEWRRSS
jgi:hypothetical protein